MRCRMELTQSKNFSILLDTEEYPTKVGHYVVNFISFGMEYAWLQALHRDRELLSLKLIET